MTAGMLADRLRPIVLGGDDACLIGTPMIPLHRATVTAIYQHLERLANMDGEETDGRRAFAAYGNPLPDMRGYPDAFYEIAGMLGIPAQMRSPREVWQQEMRPLLAKKLGLAVPA